MTEGFNEEIPVRRGRRDPELARRMRSDVQGEVVERHIPLDEGNGLEDPGDAPIETWMGLLEGDIVIAKVTHEITIGEDRSWITYGVQSRVADREDEEGAFIRVGSIVNQRVLDLAAQAAEEVQALEAARRSRPIQRRR